MDTGKTVCSDVRIAVVDGWLSLKLALRQIPTIHKKTLVLENMTSGYRNTTWDLSTDETLLDQWMQDRLKEELDILEIVEEEDGRALVSIGKKLGRDFLLDQ